MTEAQLKAWNCLREDEKQSLFLQMSNGKSTWEAGTIMERSHYKYIEIRERSQKFFRMFTEFFEIHESIFRPDVPLKQTFKDYIEMCIEKRLTRKQSLSMTGDSTLCLHRVKARLLENSMLILKESTDNWDKDTLALIMEFDRWNNFRILPKIMQAPSAYKRRNNSKYKIYLKYIISHVPDWAMDKLFERYHKRLPIQKDAKYKRYWAVFISRKYDLGYKVFPTEASEEVIREMSKFYLYLFPDDDTADTFGLMASHYYDMTGKISHGQRYWAEFRQVVETAVNYKQVNNIDFTVKTLDDAYGIQKPRKSRKSRKGGSESTTQESTS